MNIEDLLPKLLETTRRKKITWHEPMDNTFVSRIGDRKFQVGQGFDEDSGETYYRFNIYIGGGDSPYEGRFIDSMVADRFKGAFSDLEELYSEARRNALGLDKVISDIDDELDKLLM
ncbi:hypothetical protein CN151_15775 [Sinorhizobium meliloti]|uniref:hypothetical protein n=1 Tax=Rhizobium meliloti TaxID=382 RepID=UPI0002A593E6|nr:hypothetical protein [Sinorhizobium meliloti]AGA07741.1 hypothetical protein C770_GR4Chr2833 [Sinorhizobium meliloti GR4]RVL03188.1 hypothetical protein CN151_15775 [Sinorhizobium meliloti]RVM94475.1 hypothetical protein CN119_11635 [Sinorhizobium meliloti]RVN11296.1 hypothetical protein CN112_10405 [Sinorhizobium meliloti]